MWTADFFTEGELPHRDDVVRDLEAALVDANGYSLPHTIDIARRHTDWGASAALQEIVVEVARFAFEEGREPAKLAAGAGMKLLWDRWKSRRRANKNFELLQGLDAARRAAADRVARAYEVDAEALALTSDSHDPDAREWQFRFVTETHTFTEKLT